MVDFSAAALFVVGSILFFKESTTYAGTWLFLVGSIMFGLRPTIKLLREFAFIRWVSSRSPSNHRCASNHRCECDSAQLNETSINASPVISGQQTSKIRAPDVNLDRDHRGRAETLDASTTIQRSLAKLQKTAANGEEFRCFHHPKTQAIGVRFLGPGSLVLARNDRMYSLARNSVIFSNG
ncbi:YrhK family protein [Roseibium sp. SCP14]|uniref:YrhK family protein n=1 Tax=Roseibium sp. SCP14 TaxID=3141375 RepID=UPI0033356C0C